MSLSGLWVKRLVFLTSRSFVVRAMCLFISYTTWFRGNPYFIKHTYMNQLECIAYSCLCIYLYGKNLGYGHQEKQTKVVKKKEIGTLKNLPGADPHSPALIVPVAACCPHLHLLSIINLSCHPLVICGSCYDDMFWALLINHLLNHRVMVVSSMAVIVMWRLQQLWISSNST